MADLSVHTLSRRHFLRNTGIVGGAFILGASVPMAALAKSAPANAAPASAEQLGYFVSLSTNGDLTLVCQRMEMGQGILTSVPQIIADELCADWSRVQARMAEGDSKYGDQGTGGSKSIRSFFDYIRQMGAIARQMLEQAAADKWQVSIDEVHAEDHHVVHKSGKKLPFGELAEAAAKLPVPDPQTVKLKAIKDYKLVGKDVPLLGQEAIVRGEALYAQDVQLPGMLIASIERPPVVGGKVKSFDASAAKKVPGVVEVIRLKDRPYPVNVRPVSGVAVLAENTWAAQEGRKQLEIEWELGDNAKHNSESYKQELVEKVNKRGIPVREEGAVYEHEYDAERTLEATYTVPYHHHMSMETPAATAVIENGICRIWTGTQSPQWGKGLVMEELGLDPETEGDKVQFNTTIMGGAFGRKGKNDFTLEAVELAKASGKPVKVIWTREDDVKHGFYHSIAANYFKAELTKNKKSAEYWIQRTVFPPIGWIFNHHSDQPGDGELAQSFADIPFELDHLSCETAKVSTHVRTGWFRAVHNINNAFARGCFVDELAVKAGISTRKMWLNLLGKDRLVDPSQEGFEGWDNYGQKNAAHALDIRRMKAVVNTLVEKAGAEEKTADNEGWGISYATSFNSYAAAATKVRVEGKKLTVLEMHTCIDCGLVITPDRVRSQQEGAMIMGLSAALDSEITVTDGVIDQGNFHDYRILGINKCPPMFVHIIDSDKAPGGVGEPGFPPVMPSIANAVFHASGIRIRDLPLSKSLTV